MREIKFRAWNKEQWVMIDLWCLNWIMMTNTSDVELQSEIMQYTWLKDKNWVEIYEGDVVEITDIWSLSWIKKEVIYGINSNDSYWFNLYTYCVYEIKGNIYENPLTNQ